MIDWLHGRGRVEFSPLEAALAGLQLHVLEGLIAAHTAATIHPSELERNSRARGNGAAGILEGDDEQVTEAEKATLCPGVPGNAPGLFCAEGK